MRKSALLVLAAAAFPCSGCSTSPTIAADDLPGYAAEEARTDLVCPENAESIGEAREPIIPWAAALAATCILAGTIAAEYGCEHNIIEQLCPAGTYLTKTIHDTWDRGKSVTIRISCDIVRLMVCGSAGAGGGEIMRRMCAGLV